MANWAPPKQPPDATLPSLEDVDQLLDELSENDALHVGHPGVFGRCEALVWCVTGNNRPIIGYHGM
jgi:hypothetical protein